MQFRAVLKDAKLTKSGVTIRAVASDDCSTDDLRVYLEEPVMINVEIIAPEAEVEFENEALFEAE